MLSTLPVLPILALLATLALGIGLVIWSRRGTKAPRADAVAVPSEPDTPPPPRRRQLHSFVESERDNAPEPLPDAIAAPPAAPPLIEPAELAAEPPIAEPEVEAPVAEPAPDAPADSYDQAVLVRLEDAFEALQAGEISLEAYRARILEEERAVEERISALEEAGDGEALQTALVARESVRWCLDWADEQGGGEAV